PIRQATIIVGLQPAAIGDRTGWRVLADPPHPGNRTVPSLVFDPIANALVMVGGTGAAGPVDSATTWTLVGSTWREGVGAAPNTLTQQGAVFDERAGVITLFGSAFDNAVYTWDGSAWTKRPAAGAWPSQRTMTSMAYDRKHAVTVMFGGATTSS